jgi:hypothetical protein
MVTTTQPKTEIRAINPALAAQFLGRMPVNRRLARNHVLSLVEAINRGDWRFNGDPIRFNSKGKLIDGQHRLNAIIESGKTIDFLVVTDLEDEAIETVDTGNRRSFANYLEMRDERYPMSLAPAVRYFANWEKTDSFADQWHAPKRSITELAKVLDDNPGIRDSMVVLARMGNKGRLGIRAGFGTLHYIFAGIDKDDAELFFDKLTTGVELEIDNPIYQLRERLAAFKGTGVPTQLITAYAIKAWNLWRDGLTVKNLSWKGGGKNPELFPVPH